MQGKSKVITYINCPALLVWHIVAFTVSFAFKFAFSVLRIFIGTYLDTKSLDRPEQITKYDIRSDEKGNPVITDENGIHIG